MSSLSRKGNARKERKKERKKEDEEEEMRKQNQCAAKSLYFPSKTTLRPIDLVINKRFNRFLTRRNARVFSLNKKLFTKVCSFVRSDERGKKSERDARNTRAQKHASSS